MQIFKATLDVAFERDSSGRDEDLMAAIVWLTSLLNAAGIVVYVKSIEEARDDG
jgi:predicted transcriptional regulator